MTRSARAKRAYTRRQPLAAKVEALDTLRETYEAPVDQADPEGVVHRASMRPETMRGNQDPIMDAKQRAIEIMSHIGASGGQMTDTFAVDQSKLPDGYEAEWKMEVTAGKEFPERVVANARNGWEYVPAYMMPELMPKGSQETAIRRDGLALMMRPKQVNDHFRELARRDALAPVQQLREKLGDAPPGQFERTRRQDVFKVGVEYGPPPADRIPVPK